MNCDEKRSNVRETMEAIAAYSNREANRLADECGVSPEHKTLIGLDHPHPIFEALTMNFDEWLNGTHYSGTTGLVLTEVPKPTSPDGQLFQDIVELLRDADMALSRQDVHRSAYWMITLGRRVREMKERIEARQHGDVRS